MIILNYTADVSVGETAPSPISPEPWCRKDTIRGGRCVDGGDACHVSAGDSPAGVCARAGFFAAHRRKSKRARVLCEREGELTETARLGNSTGVSNSMPESSAQCLF